ncbi:MAG: hypothetical protein F4X44_03050 [Gammaproteobacteria bacterium]|nr:hypothetical protein [Gammaproteobacteria bacterium]MYD79572.1 hypothetical protein [Gammaproteobacteria bacterium]
MSATQDRVGALAKKLLDPEREADFDVAFSEREVSSMDAIAFAKALAAEFNHEIPAEKFANFKNLRDVVSYLDANA